MTKRLTPQETIDGHLVIDARVSPNTGKDLAEEISTTIQFSQLFIQHQLPDRLIVTQKQHVSLNPYTEEMYHTEDRMFQVYDPEGKGVMCVMEVTIDRDIDTVEEIEQVMADTEALKAQRSPDALKEMTDHGYTDSRYHDPDLNPHDKPTPPKK